MKKVSIFLLLLTFISCNVYRQANIYKRVANKGYVGMKYKFSDSGNRNIEIEFISDSIIHINNKPNIAQTYYLFSFNSIYSYRILDIGGIYINRMLSSDKNLGKDSYIKPFSIKQYSHNNNEVNVFPNLEGDTIRFSSDYRKLQVREFCFDRD